MNCQLKFLARENVNEEIRVVAIDLGKSFNIKKSEWYLCGIQGLKKKNRNESTEEGSSAQIIWKGRRELAQKALQTKKKS